MTISNSQLPERIERTFFSSGRAAFIFLLEQVIKPRKLYLPTLICPSLVKTTSDRLPELELVFYPVLPDLNCEFPSTIESDAALLMIHYFGYVNLMNYPDRQGTVIEDASHSLFSKYETQADFVFGSLRKLLRLGDGGFVQGQYNPVYEPSRKLDTWLRYEASDWLDLKEAENMIDRCCPVGDMSSQSVATMYEFDIIAASKQRRQNEQFLAANLEAGEPLRRYLENETSLVHQRLLSSSEDRDRLRAYLAERGIFTAVLWNLEPSLIVHPTTDAAALLASRSLAFPVGDCYRISDMEKIVRAVNEWFQT